MSLRPFQTNLVPKTLKTFFKVANLVRSTPATASATASEKCHCLCVFNAFYLIRDHPFIDNCIEGAMDMFTGSFVTTGRDAGR